MARPSQNIDRRLLEAGLELLPSTGCRGLSARKLTDHAGVNLGMFHYHFRSKDNFIRILLQEVYEQMFSMLMLRVSEGEESIANLRNALLVLAHFAQAHRQLLLRIAADALAGEPVAVEFLQTNVPRHLRVLSNLIGEAQRGGKIVSVPLPQALAFVGGAILAPILLGTAVLESHMLPSSMDELLDHDVLSKSAVEQRIEFALRGLSVGEVPCTPE